ncbi:hypothetical protein BDP55DRAFT_679934 [Colletotrichum godetiae]|uniref:Uncharacterized protein n=1 Tax=Colletotrichum godetiae TaxID=1209918 RepID=A0AAJ0EP76_9PEZI|nr:uncharacterized protein BDP55DRAFT_679934 [Colletotrichum godetiae]KAK1659401.1 hypothetical protein BDP55DRAFT_679934 [Colletotrichum godetiae]
MIHIVSDFFFIVHSYLVHCCLANGWQAGTGRLGVASQPLDQTASGVKRGGAGRSVLHPLLGPPLAYGPMLTMMVSVLFTWRFLRLCTKKPSTPDCSAAQTG